MSCTLSAEQLAAVHAGAKDCLHLANLKQSRENFFAVCARLDALEAQPNIDPERLAAARNEKRAAAYQYEQCQEITREARPDVFGAAPVAAS